MKSPVRFKPTGFDRLKPPAKVHSFVHLEKICCFRLPKSPKLLFFWRKKIFLESNIFIWKKNRRKYNLKMSSRLTFASLIPKFKRLGQYIDIHGDYIEFFKSFFNYLVLSSFVRDKTGFNRIKPCPRTFAQRPTFLPTLSKMVNEN